MIKLPAMLERMYALSVWNSEGKQFLPTFDYEWRDVTNYLPAEEAIMHNTNLWFQDQGTPHDKTAVPHCPCRECKELS